MSISLLLTIFLYAISSIEAGTIYDRAGNYTLGANLTGDFLPIQISTDHVTLNLNRKQVSGGDIGIIIDANITDVLIQQGTIFGFTGTGIYVSDGCSNIRFHDISVSDCTYAGIAIDGNPNGQGIQEGKITNCFISSCTGSSSTPAYGLRAIAMTNLQIIDSEFQFNDAGTTNAGYGLKLEGCSTCDIIRCRSLNNGGSYETAGFYLSNCIACSLNSCSSVSNIAHDLANTSTAYGFLLSGCTSCTLTRNKAVNNSNATGQTYGFLFRNGQATGVTFCTSQGNVGTTYAAGLRVTGSESNTAILNSQTVANRASFINGQSFGILVDGPQGCAIVGNIISANIGATGIGLRDTTNNTNNYIAENLSFANTTTGYDVTRTVGAFPVLFASVGDFSSIQTISKYPNIAIVS